MTKKYKGKYKGGSRRWSKWDYRNNAAYFVTICTKNRVFYFGQIDLKVEWQNRWMRRSGIGNIAKRMWREIPAHFPFVKLGEFVIMPNHVHGIVIIQGNNSIGNHDSTKNEDRSERSSDIQQNKNKIMAKIPPKKGSLSSVIRSYKSVVTREARRIKSNFAWQSRFHDHVIRNKREYQRIADYIMDNPKNWKGV